MAATEPFTSDPFVVGKSAGEQWCAKRGFAHVADLTGATIDAPPMETFAAAAMPIGWRAANGPKPKQ